MRRDDIKSIMELAQKIDCALSKLPYDIAVAAKKQLEEIRNIISVDLPGHEYAECPECEEAKGIDEMVSCEDETVCEDCYKKLVQAQNS